MFKKRSFWVIALLVVLTVVGAAVASAQGPADPSSGGSMSGTITAESGGSALVDIPVRVLDRHTGAHRATRTDDAGHYSLSNLRPGDYLVWAGGGQSGYLAELYDNVSPRDVKNANPVHVSAGNEAGGIDFALSTGGSISGDVTAAADGAPLSGIHVVAFPAGAGPHQQGNKSLQTPGFKGNQGENRPERDAPSVDSSSKPDKPHLGAVTDETGHYTITGLPTGDFIVVAGGRSDYVPQAYSESGGEPTPVSVVAGEETTGIDFALGAGGAISGQVTDDTGSPLANANVRAFDPDTHMRKGSRTDEQGNYTISGLKSGSYLVVANAQGYLLQFYDGATSRDTATPVAVEEGNTVTGIDFSLPSGGTISGVVTDEESGQPVAGLRVAAGSAGSRFHRVARTADDGSYAIEGLPGGSYVVGVLGGREYAGEFYDNVGHRDEATPVEVTAGEQTSNINFALAKKTR